MADDPIEVLAERLYAAFYTDTKLEGTPWPPAKRVARQAWRRVAALAIDLGAKP